ncbi:MAG: TetR/AcrR family transcriptional regulator [Candidatus Bathyarchaeota archaeon]|nr:TetR/AcrR family transcriptional regulator [Candidatus Bathyarchaeota archaeon]
MCPNATHEERQRTHERILEAAEALFLRDGIAETSINDIVAESGLSKGALYNHFESKEALLLAIHERQVEKTLASISASFPEGATPVEKLKMLGDLVFASSARFPREFLAMNTEFFVVASRTPSLAPGLTRRYNGIHGFIKGIIEEGVESGVFREDVSADQVATILFAAADGLNLHYATAGIDVDWHRTEETLLDTVLNGLLRR